MAASELKNGTAHRRVKQKSSVIAHFDHRKNVFNLQLSFLIFFLSQGGVISKEHVKTRLPTGCCNQMKKIAIVTCRQKASE